MMAKDAIKRIEPQKTGEELTVEQAIRLLADGVNLLDRDNPTPFRKGPWQTFTARMRWDGESLFVDGLDLSWGDQPVDP